MWWPNQTKTSTSAKSKFSVNDHVKTQFQFSYLVEKLSRADNQCKHTITDISHNRVECVAWLEFLLAAEMRDLMVLFMVVLHWNTPIVTTVYIPVVLCNKHTVMVFCHSTPPPPLLFLSHTCHGRFCKVFVSLFCFHKFCYTGYIFLARCFLLP
jgi:hypothetical protein